ncbi:amino acid transporter [Methylobacterium indicum]|uniref:nucleotidyltransferase domain-containing protein n=1 Tax=Methylobacterium indicum TaxID=1775910 RepID=UPI000734F871|nr:amino acid transporter [Methylobacterium indicum]KTS38873.1 amino acid transporter [Methylobacterium indicum]KTS40387.1 amino acid transporter [Methylobacterium indicum]KTS45149.1 amino acid transporter [Methylobacterium indicum]
MGPLDDDAWDAWSPDELGRRLRGARRPWYVAGGWALDVWHGRATREHDDLEFVVLRDDADHFRAILHDLEFFTVRDGILEHLPPSAHLPGDVWQVWGADMQRGRWRVDMMMEPGTPDRWIYKRDPTIEMARSAAVRVSKAGIPYLAPINVILFKAKYRREKDERDFEIARQEISAAEREQLIAWLDVLHPGHDWIETLRIGGERDAGSTGMR